MIVEPFSAAVLDGYFADFAFQKPDLQHAVFDALLGQDDIHQQLAPIPAIEDDRVFQIADGIFGEWPADKLLLNHLFEIRLLEERYVANDESRCWRRARGLNFGF